MAQSDVFLPGWSDLLSGFFKVSRLFYFVGFISLVSFIFRGRPPPPHRDMGQEPKKPTQESGQEPKKPTQESGQESTGTKAGTPTETGNLAGTKAGNPTRTYRYQGWIFTLRITYIVPLPSTAELYQQLLTPSTDGVITPFKLDFTTKSIRYYVQKLSWAGIEPGTFPRRTTAVE